MDCPRPPDGPLLRSQYRLHACCPPGTEYASLFGQRWQSLPHAGAQAEGLPLLLERAAEAGRGRTIPEPAHGVIALFAGCPLGVAPAPVVLLEPIVQGAVGAVDDVAADRFADRARIG